MENSRSVIRRTILSMNQPFNTTDMFYIMERKYGICNRDLILEIMDELCESGILDFSELSNGQWAFKVN